MRVQVVKKELEDILKKAQNVIERKTTLSVLSQIKVQALKDKHLTHMSIQCTDFETIYQGFTESVEIEEQGVFAVSGKLLYDIVKTIPSPTVKIETEDKKVKIQSGNSVFYLNTYPVEEFPSLGSFETATYYTLKKDIVRTLVDATSFSLSSDYARPELQGLYFKIESKEKVTEIETVSSDGHRLSKAMIRVEPISDQPFEAEVIIHRKGLTAIRALFDSLEEDMKIGFSEKYMYARVGNNFIGVRPIDAKFPNYRTFIPKEFPVKIVVSRDTLADILRRVSIFNTPSLKSVTFNFKNNVLEIVSLNPELGMARDELPIEYDGDDISINFNFQFILDILDVITEPMVIFNLISSTEACQIYPEKQEAFEQMYIVMPMTPTFEE